MELFEIYNRIINEDLRPSNFQSDGQSLEQKIAELEIIPNDFVNYIKYLDKHGEAYDLKVTDPDTQEIISNVSRNNNFKELIDLDIPPIPDKKGEIYYDLIHYEYVRSLSRIEQNIVKNSTNELKEFATINIQKLKILWYDFEHYKKLIIEGKGLDYKKSNDFVLMILEVFIERTISDILELYEPYFDKEFFGNTYKYFFGERDRRMKIIDSKILEIKLDNLAKEYKKKTGFNLPWSAFLFQQEREEISKFPDIKDRLKRYNEILTFWRRSILSDPTLDDDNDISNRMIPLIENEIADLKFQLNLSTESEINPQSPIKSEVTRQAEIDEDSATNRINLREITKTFFDNNIESKQIDINRDDFVSSSKKTLFAKINKEYGTQLSNKNRESIRTYLSKLKTEHLNSVNKKRKKK